MRFSQRMVLLYIRTKFSFLSAISKRKAAEVAFDLFCTPQVRNTKKLPPVFRQAELLKFRFEENTIMGYRWGHPSEKKILILHGFESSIVNFDRYIKPFTERGYEVLGFDAPGHGKSSGKMINALLYKQLITEIDKNFGKIKNFIAHSLGGLAASLYLEETPHDASYKLVLIAPATETTTAINSFFDFLQLDASIRTGFDNIIIERSGHSPEWFSISRMAREIKAEVLWLHDKDDRVTPYNDVVPVSEANYPNFRFLISEGLGHRRIYRDNKSFKAVVAFFA